MKRFFIALTLLATPAFSDNILFDRASKEFDEALPLTADTAPKRNDTLLTCAIIDSIGSRLYPGVINQFYVIHDDVVGNYSNLIIELPELGRRDVIMLDTPDGELGTSDRFITIRESKKHDKLMIRVLRKTGEPYQICWERTTN